ncbi:MAG: UDP-N-acetylmuramate--L-alanine ligase [Symploca sp. SIO2B6]|nr:UDP-N-acetylmuramate--L-alanine ligase [Symploca sp. SIO2B6]
MPNSIDFRGRPFHFIGIGGIGMSAIAHILTRQQLPVSGSDVRLSHITQRLQEQGVHIFLSQDAENLQFFQSNDLPEVAAVGVLSIAASSEKGSHLGSAASLSPSAYAQDKSTVLLPQVVCSTAIHSNNPEYNAALEMGCPIYHRSDILAALVARSKGIAVAGTHGKTTTSSMIGYLLLHAGLDPSIVVGGEVEAWEGNARLGDGDYLVAEADESDGSLVKFAPYIGVITNIELDHPDHYKTLDEVVQTFKAFSQNCSKVVACADCDNINTDISPAVTYSLDASSDATYRATNVVYGSSGTHAEIWEGTHLLGNFWLPLLGQHNLSNALAAIAVGRLINIGFDTIVDAFASFKGARRRFECRGAHHNIIFIDDYAHHPSEIQATLAAARLQVGPSKQAEERRVVAVFQPHRYSRASMFIDEFGESFKDADLVIATEVYSAGEPPANINGQCVAEAIATHHPSVFYRSTLADTSALLKQTLRPGDLVIFLGAGNLNRIIPDLLNFYEQVEVTDLPTVYSAVTH